MLRLLVSYTDLADRHGRRPALKVLCQLERLADIEPKAVVSLDFDARFDRALTIVSRSNAAGHFRI